MNTKENEGYIQLTDEQFDEFYQHFGSNNFQLQGSVLGDLGTKQLDIYFKSLGFATTIVGTIGLVAGFGFTAFDHVQSTLLFFTGEGFLISAILYDLFWVQEKYQKEFNALEEERRKFIGFYEERNKIFISLYNSWTSKRVIDKNAFTKLNETDKKSIELFKTEENRPIGLIYPPLVYRLMIVGVLVLLSSFFIIDLIYFFLGC